MRQVVLPISIVQKILGEQKKNEGAPCRLTAHCVRVERPEGALLYHTLTGELLLLSHEEAALLETLPGPVPPALEALWSRWFLRPEGADDMVLADQVRQIVSRFQRKETALTKYIIFTTTACNARCFYCFEAGWETHTMTDETARDTAAYIGAHRGGKPVKLEWFGGEPLVNTRAIDIITGSLREQGAAFRSTMVSNGYLFDEALVLRARDAWNLDEVQITLDGTEDVYNARKAYVRPEGSPFQRVLRNIGLLLDAGVPVRVRLNLDVDNEEDLYALADQLAERFGGKPGFGVCVMVFYENAGPAPVSYTEQQRRAYAQKLRTLRAYLEKKGIMNQMSIRRGLLLNACLADNDNSTTVTPEGRLGRCESCKDGGVWGSVWSEERDEEVLRQWRERRPPEAVCQTCIAYPQCFRINRCPNWPEHCSPIEQAYREDRLYRAVLGTYEQWKAAGQT